MRRGEGRPTRVESAQTTRLSRLSRRLVTSLPTFTELRDEFADLHGARSQRAVSVSNYGGTVISALLSLPAWC